jgi:NADH-quinone oxidoreductase subunit L
MVAAGVFLVVRAHVFFDLSDHASTVVAWVGAITALFAATVAIVQDDIKRVLAYSTISQLGYMFLAVGVGAYSAAIFHMVMHAFFKALLFLAAGSVIHGIGDEQDMRRMGGLKKYLPITAGTFIVGWLAIAGVFPFDGFWSKDEILAKAYFNHDYLLWAVGLVAALATAFYMTRQVWLVFYGDERWKQDAVPATGVETTDQGAEIHAGSHGEPHESPWIMTIPLVALAALATVGFVINLPFDNSKLNLLDRWLEPVLRGAPEIRATSFGAGFALSTGALVIAIVGIVVGRALYRNGLDAKGDDPAVERLGPFAKVLANAYYLDAGLARFVSGPATSAARFLNEGIDRDVIDGAVNGVGRAFRGIGGGLRKVQTGLVRNYALAIVVGAVLLVAFVTTRASL